MGRQGLQLLGKPCLSEAEITEQVLMVNSDKSKKVKSKRLLTSFLDWERPLKRFIGRFLFKPEDIDDMAQETFLRAYSATQGRELDSPKAYLFRVAKTVALKELARKSRQMTDFLEEAQVSEPEADASLEEEVMAEQKIRLFFDAIAELPPQCRRVFLMRKHQGLSHKEIARELGISTSAVEKHIALGAERCKKFIESREKGALPENHDISVLNTGEQP